MHTVTTKGVDVKVAIGIKWHDNENQLLTGLVKNIALQIILKKSSSQMRVPGCAFITSWIYAISAYTVRANWINCLISMRTHNAGH